MEAEKLFSEKGCLKEHSMDTPTPLFLVSNSSTTLTKDDVSRLMQSTNISSKEFEFLLPKRGERANKPPEGYISVYDDQIGRGLRFPLHELVLQICNRVNVSPSQLTPNAHGAIVGFILCAKLHSLPLTADCFFSHFRCGWGHSERILLFQERRSGPRIVTRDIPFRNGWKRKFFFLRPVGKPWNCLTKWKETHCATPKIRPGLKDSFQDLARKSGVHKCGFELRKLIEKDILVHGGIEPGIPSPQFTFGYLMHRATAIKFELLPEDIPPAIATTKASPPASYVSSAAPSSSKVPVINFSSYSEGLYVKLEEGGAEPHKKKNRTVLESDEDQSQSPPAPLVSISKTLQPEFVPKDCYEKLEKENQEVSSELSLMRSSVHDLKQENEQYKAKIVDLELTNSSVQEENELYNAKIDDLELTISSVQVENELYKSKIVDSEHTIFKANVKVNILEKKLKNLKSESDSIHDKIKKDAIEEFKSSDEFANAVHEEAAEYYINGFETCKQRVLNSGKLPSGLNFDFFDAADAEQGSSPGPVDNTAADSYTKSLKRKKA